MRGPGDIRLCRHSRRTRTPRRTQSGERCARVGWHQSRSLRWQSPERRRRILLGLRDLDAKSLRGVPEASVVAVQTPEILAQAHDGYQVQGVE